MGNRARTLAWEARWARPAALATFAGVVLLIVSTIVITQVSGEHESTLLHSAHEHSSSVLWSSVMEAVGFVLFVAPLVFLFRADAARDRRVRNQLIGLIVAAPLFFSVSAVLNAAATNEAANQFIAGEATSKLTPREAASECREELKEQGAKEFGEEYEDGPNPLSDCAKTQVADDEAKNALSEASLRAPATGFGLAGRIGLAIALFYTCLYGMRTGLLSRFWGSLGMAIGVAALLLLVQFSLIWFIYFGLLLMGWLPRGRPPAWAAGEAIPWPSPGERAAAELQPEPVPGDEDRDEPAAEDGGEGSEADRLLRELEAGDGDGGDGPGEEPRRRKRKRRD